MMAAYTGCPYPVDRLSSRNCMAKSTRIVKKETQTNLRPCTCLNYSIRGESEQQMQAPLRDVKAVKQRLWYPGGGTIFSANDKPSFTYTHPGKDIRHVIWIIAVAFDAETLTWSPLHHLLHTSCVQETDLGQFASTLDTVVNEAGKKSSWGSCKKNDKPSFLQICDTESQGQKLSILALINIVVVECAWPLRFTFSTPGTFTSERPATESPHSKYR